MSRKQITPGGTAVTALVLEVFRLNGRLLAAGDRLIAKLGMTSARWQVLGAVALAPGGEPVANLARNMGLNRQGVQRIVDELAAQDIVQFRVNPHHRRAKLVLLTPKGRRMYDAIADLQVPWANALAKALDPPAIATAAAMLKTLRLRLEQQVES